MAVPGVEEVILGSYSLTMESTLDRGTFVLRVKESFQVAVNLTE